MLCVCLMARVGGRGGGGGENVKSHAIYMDLVKTSISTSILIFSSAVFEENI